MEDIRNFKVDDLSFNGKVELISHIDSSVEHHGEQIRYLIECLSCIGDTDTGDDGELIPVYDATGDNLNPDMNLEEMKPDEREYYALRLTQMARWKSELKLHLDNIQVDLERIRLIFGL